MKGRLQGFIKNTHRGGEPMKANEVIDTQNENAFNTETKQEISKKRRARRWRRFKGNYQYYLLLLVPLTFVIVFKYLPMFGISIAFMEYKIARGFLGSEWVGLKHFKEIFGIAEAGGVSRAPEFFRALRNTLLLNVLDLSFGFTMPIVLALLLNEIRNQVFKRINQSLLYLPHFLSWVIIGGLAYQLLARGSGMVNNLFAELGWNRIPFLQEDYHWLFSYIGISVWQSMGWGTIIYLAAISGINSELYEAATVDGAARLRKMWHVTLPGIRMTIVTLLILSLGGIMGGSFEQIMALANKAVTQFTTTIPVLVYRWGLLRLDGMSLATAIGLFQSVVGLIMVLIADRIAKKLGEDGIL